MGVLLLTIMVYLLGTGLFVRSWQALFYSDRSGEVQRAQSLAEAAVDFALVALNATVPTGDDATLLPLPPSFVASGERAWRYVDAANGHFFADQFDGAVPELTIRQPAGVPLPDGAGTAADYRIVDARAVLAGGERRVRAIARLELATVSAPRSLFERAIFSRGTIDTSGSAAALRTDSYDSARGAYGGANLGSRGDVHTNGAIVGGGVYAGQVRASGSVDARVSAQGPDNTVQTGTAPENLPELPALPTPAVMQAWVPGAALAPPAGTVWQLGDVRLSGNEHLTLHPGRYLLGSLHTSGQAKLVVVGGGLTDLYVIGDVAVAGNGLVTASQLPQDLRLIAAGTGPVVSIAGNGAFYGTLLAPGRPVTIGGNGVIYGAVVADGVTFNGSNAAIHYDEAVGRLFTVDAGHQRPVRFRVVAVDVPGKGD